MEFPEDTSLDQLEQLSHSRITTNIPHHSKLYRQRSALHPATSPMAKFGEGDDRWLVKDLGEGGRNVRQLRGQKKGCWQWAGGTAGGEGGQGWPAAASL